jgi:hypothetical protein
MVVSGQESYHFAANNVFLAKAKPMGTIARKNAGGKIVRAPAAGS